MRPRRQLCGRLGSGPGPGTPGKAGSGRVLMSSTRDLEAFPNRFFPANPLEILSATGPAPEELYTRAQSKTYTPRPGNLGSRGDGGNALSCQHIRVSLELSNPGLVAQRWPYLSPSLLFFIELKSEPADGALATQPPRSTEARALGLTDPHPGSILHTPLQIGVLSTEARLWMPLCLIAARKAPCKLLRGIG